MNARQAYNLRAIVAGALRDAGYSLADIVPTLRLRSKEDARNLLGRARRIRPYLDACKAARAMKTAEREWAEITMRELLRRAEELEAAGDTKTASDCRRDAEYWRTIAETSHKPSKEEIAHTAMRVWHERND